MVPYIAKRGHSFKGAGMYYLHDKEADTSERVAWTYTHNLPTDDPEKAMRWMAYTASNSDVLKEKAGIKRTGRKATAGSVYSFSLAWHPEQSPEQDYMRTCAMDALEFLGLTEHEAVLVAHQETEHDHVHCIVNLIHPETGKTFVPSYDRLALSKWAEERENIEGKIYCEERVKNNEKRREQGADLGLDKSIIKHREKKLDISETIQALYEQSDSGKAFMAALKEDGFDLAKGDRRGFVLVDDYGNIHSLSRQLKGQRAKDIKARLSDLDMDSMGIARELADQKKHWDREAAYLDQLKKDSDAGIENSKKKKKSDGQWGETIKRDQTPPQILENMKWLDDLDRKRAAEAELGNKLDKKRAELNQFYGLKGKQKEIDDLKNELKKKSRFNPGKQKKLNEELERKTEALKNIKSRMEENLSALEKKYVSKDLPETKKEQDPQKDVSQDLESKDNVKKSKDDILDKFNKKKPPERGLDLDR